MHKALLAVIVGNIAFLETFIRSLEHIRTTFIYKSLRANAAAKCGAGYEEQAGVSRIT